MNGDVMMALSAACLALAVCGVLLTLRSRAPAAGYLIVIFGLMAGLTAFPLVAALNQPVAIGVFPWLLPALLALSPAVFFYVRARCVKAALGWPDWPHLVLPLVGALLSLCVSLLEADTKAMVFGEGVLPDGGYVAGLMLAVFALAITAPLVSLGYLWVSVGQLRTYRAWLKHHLSNLEKRERRWVDALILGLVGLWGLVGVALLSDNLGGALWVSGEAVLAAAAAVLMLMLSFALMSEPEAVPEAELRPAPRYQNSSLSPDAAEALVRRLDAAMRDDALYLDPNLSLDRLARHLRAAPDHISQTLNAYMETNFFDFVAHWRVEAAKDRLHNDPGSVLEIAINVGFNSRSTFYKAFKRATGLTPTAYRQSARDGAA